MREQEPYRARSIRFAKKTAMKVGKAAAVQLTPVLYKYWYVNRLARYTLI
jgi:hypothetical protein